MVSSKTNNLARSAANNRSAYASSRGYSPGREAAALSAAACRAITSTSAASLNSLVAASAVRATRSPCDTPSLYPWSCPTRRKASLDRSSRLLSLVRFS